MGGRRCRLENLHDKLCGCAACAGLEACTTRNARTDRRFSQYPLTPTLSRREREKDTTLLCGCAACAGLGACTTRNARADRRFSQYPLTPTLTRGEREKDTTLEARVNTGSPNARGRRVCRGR